MSETEEKISGIIGFADEQIPIMMKLNGIPGLSIALVHGDGTIWQKGYGTTCLENGASVTADTMFSLQSISKTYTTFGFLMAADKGLVSLDDRLVDVVPEFTVNSRWGADQAKLITFRHLLSHRSGLLHEAPVGNNYGIWNNTFEEHARSIFGTWLKFPVGQGYGYSNLGIDLVAYALERIAGMPFEEYMERELFTPMGMGRTTFSQAKALAEPDFALGHIGGRFVSRRAIPMMAGGGLYSSASDLAKFVAFMLTGGSLNGRKPVGDELMAEMLKPQFCAEGQKFGYGLGVDIQEHRGHRLINHCGGGYGYLTVQEWIPELDAGVVILTNSASHNNVQVPISRTAFDLIEIFMKQPPGENKPEWSGYQGTYCSPLFIDPVVKRVSVLNGYLFADNEKLDEYEPGLFFAPDGTSVRFAEGKMAFGNVSYLKETADER